MRTNEYIRNVWTLLGRLLYRLARIVWWPLGLKTQRTRCLVLVGNNVLLIKNWLGSGKWTLPGGGVKAGEAVEDAALRELSEELGIVVEKNQLRHIGTTELEQDKLTYSVELFALRLPRRPELQVNWELTDASWFGLGMLPEDCSEIVKSSLNYID